jgi:hypothetical protein
MYDLTVSSGIKYDRALRAEHKRMCLISIKPVGLRNLRMSAGSFLGAFFAFFSTCGQKSRLSAMRAEFESLTKNL